MATPLEIVKAFYAKLTAGDAGGALALMSDEIEWITMMDYKVAGRGPQKVLEGMLVPAMQEWEPYTLTPHEFICDGGKVVSVGRFKGTNRMTGKHVGVDYSHIWEVRDGKAVAHGSRLAFRHGGALMDPVTQQLAFDFAMAEGMQLKALRTGTHGAGAATGLGAVSGAAKLQEMFVRAVQLEESAASLAEAIEMYHAILEMKPEHAAACINLGTIFYNQRDFSRAEQMYRRATEADPEYALAFFDLGNVLDEMQRLDNAIEAYQRAIQIVPHYADAHYNLALAFERKNERRRALRHWMTYVRLDPVGPWATHAKGQAKKILAMERISIVSRGGRLVKAVG